MTFRLRTDAQRWFSEISAQHALWDLYYFCLMTGLAAGRKRDPAAAKLQTHDLIREFIDPYKPAQQLIVGLLIEAELKLAAIDPSEKAAVRAVIRRLISTDGQAGLTQQGFDAMNAFASAGYEFLAESRQDKPRSSEAFHRDFVAIIAEAVASRAA